MTRPIVEMECGQSGRGQDLAGAEIVGRGEWCASALGEPPGDFVFGDSGDQAHNSRLHGIEIEADGHVLAEGGDPHLACPTGSRKMTLTGSLAHAAAAASAMRARIRIGTIYLVYGSGFGIVPAKSFLDPAKQGSYENACSTQRRRDRRDKRREAKASSTKGEKNSASSRSVFSALISAISASLR